MKALMSLMITDLMMLMTFWCLFEFACKRVCVCQLRRLYSWNGGQWNFSDSFGFMCPNILAWLDAASSLVDTIMLPATKFLFQTNSKFATIPSDFSLPHTRPSNDPSPFGKLSIKMGPLCLIGIFPAVHYQAQCQTDSGGGVD